MDPQELQRASIKAAEKDLRAILDRDFSASRMSTTKWAEVAEWLGASSLKCNVKFVDVPDKVFEIKRFRHVTGDWFDCGSLGPFTSISIEWAEIDHLEDIEKQLTEMSVPYDRESDRIRIIGHVRNAE
ncbi:hypothetical protein CCAX7_31230 [Capsulimonas corticalis]|uniref:Uncharacterized protein n=1 Tax=Capsulimonas corticalis TaxID=2219043 RepID=A0A402CSI3_9BACT|nr:DUF6678 family protein [Capsulimonas corticalis]BDI31072.1 hypothetical protein CCAX7_31230 [Capsulimonas corticalis]